MNFDTCEDVRSRTSDWIDDRFSPEERALVAAHLGQCSACREELELQYEISRRLRHEEPEPLASDFAMRVRASAGHTGSFRLSGPLMRKVAAVLIVGLSITAAYLLGRRHGEQAPAPRESTDRSAKLQEHERVRAARLLVDDLSKIEEVPEPIRTPLLQAQLDHFQLPTWAHRHRVREEAPAHDRDLAALVVDLDRLLKNSPDMPALLDLSRRARRRVTSWPSLTREPKGVWIPKVVVTLPENLSPEIRTNLSRYLILKESEVRGALPPGFDFPDVFDGTRWNGNVERTLGKIFGESGGNGEVTIEEETSENGYVYRIVVRTRDR